MQQNHSIPNRQHRNPIKFDVWDLFDAVSRDEKFLIDSDQDKTKFVKMISESLNKNKTPTMLYGRRAETMFAYIAASLGKCTFVKKEDSGDVFCCDNIVIPDYRVVLNDGTQLLVEVKNYHQKNAFDNFNLQTDYLNRLIQYSELMKINLYIAVYWSKWNIWTLVEPKNFEQNGEKSIMKFVTAMAKNQMIILGDYTVATTPPLALRIYPDTRKPHNISKHRAEFVIGSVELLCNNKILIDDNEKRLAFALILYGEWKEQNYIKTTISTMSEVEYIEFSYSPTEYEKQQDFSIIGSLSSIISRQYGQLTAPSGKVERLSPFSKFGVLGFIIPDEWKGDVLPLWRFYIEPKKD